MNAHFLLIWTTSRGTRNTCKGMGFFFFFFFRRVNRKKKNLTGEQKVSLSAFFIICSCL